MGKIRSTDQIDEASPRLVLFVFRLVIHCTHCVVTDDIPNGISVSSIEHS